ncbi:MAG: hypothetical protein ABFD04_03055 [Syntrophomonas sp.]
MKEDAETGKMDNHITVAGVLKPEKLACGPCPGCRAIIDVWISEKGVELSLHGEGYNKEK